MFAMPSSDPWHRSRKYAVIIDAGSSGSRSMVYSWKDIQPSGGGHASQALPAIVKGTEDGRDWSKNIDGGLSSLAGNTGGVTAYLWPLLVHAHRTVPAGRHADTPIFLLATAGMRLLSDSDQHDIVSAVCNTFRFTGFRVDTPIGNVAPCGHSAAVITGEDEGRYGWIAANYLKGSFGSGDRSPPTYGFVDMGGASTQIAFAFAPGDISNPSETAVTPVPVRIRLLNGHEHHYNLFTASWLSFGADQARARYNQSHLPAGGISSTEASNNPTIHPDPCLPPGLELPFILPGEAPPSHVLKGTGQFGGCLKLTKPPLERTPCTPRITSSDVCLFGGKWAPTINFSTAKFIGVSGYWYATDPILDQGGVYNYTRFGRAVNTFCGREWGSIEREWQESRPTSPFIPHDDAPSLPPFEVGFESLRGERGVWGPHVSLEHLQSQCFRAAWITNILHHGFGFPRKVTGRTSVTPLLDIVDKIDGTTVSWTLGKAVDVASLSIPSREPDTEDIVASSFTSSSQGDIPFVLTSASSDLITEHPHSLPFPYITSLFALLALIIIIGYRIHTRLSTPPIVVAEVDKKMENGDL